MIKVPSGALFFASRRAISMVEVVFLKKRTLWANTLLARCFVMESRLKLSSIMNGSSTVILRVLIEQLRILNCNCSIKTRCVYPLKTRINWVGGPISRVLFPKKDSLGRWPSIWGPNYLGPLAANPGTRPGFFSPLFGLAPSEACPLPCHHGQPGALTSRFHPFLHC